MEYFDKVVAPYDSAQAVIVCKTSFYFLLEKSLETQNH